MPRYRMNDDDEESTGHKFKHYDRNRYICDVLEEMRKLVDKKNIKPLAGLIEEAQSLANRMEAGLGDRKDLLSLSKETALARQAYKKLQAEYKELEAKVKPLRPKKKS